MPMIPQAVFLIKSPLQMLNALEAQAHYGLSSEQTLWIFLPDSKGRPQLERLVRQDTSGRIQHFLADLPLTFCRGSVVSDAGTGRSRLFANPLFSLLKLTRLAKLWTEIPLVFLGDLANPLMRHYVNSVRTGQVVHLDDGVATLTYAAGRHTAVVEKELKRNKRVKLAVKRRLLGLRDEIPAALTFFTLFKGLRVGPCDQVVEHSFSSLRDSLAKALRDDKIYFLGAPLVEAGFLTEVDYVALLQRVGRYYAGKEVVYIVHRREDAQRISRIGQVTGWQTQLFDYPIEYQFARIGPLPVELSSFFSSALETCQQIFADQLQVRSFGLPNENLVAMSEEKRIAVERLYRRYEQLMPVIELESVEP
jgi:hypothetical protein